MRTILGMACLVLLCTCGAAPVDDGVKLAATTSACQAAFVQPAGTVAVNFQIDDRANRVYGEGDLKWKGSFLADPVTRIMTFDPFWSGTLPGGEWLSGWPTLYDDGPWTQGGHEPRGARAGDHVWGVTAFVAPSGTDPITFEYGLTDASYELTLGSGWIWNGPNGSFTVPPGATAAIDASGMRFEKFGKVDLRLVLDTKSLAQFEGWTWDTSWIGVKSSWWGWGTFAMESEGDGVYAVQLDALLDTGALPHTGLMRQGAVAEFVFVLGPDEYKAWYTDGTNWWAVALADGVTAATRCKNGGEFVAQPIEVISNGNTAVTAPSACRHH
jgi:hypothetical protein